MAWHWRAEMPLLVTMMSLFNDAYISVTRLHPNLGVLATSGNYRHEILDIFVGSNCGFWASGVIVISDRHPSIPFLPGDNEMLSNSPYLVDPYWCIAISSINTKHAVEAKSMGWCKKDVTPFLTHWSYVFLALTIRNDEIPFVFYPWVSMYNFRWDYFPLYIYNSYKNIWKIFRIM